MYFGFELLGRRCVLIFLSVSENISLHPYTRKVSKISFLFGSAYPRIGWYTY